MKKLLLVGALILGLGLSSCENTMTYEDGHKQTYRMIGETLPEHGLIIEATNSMSSMSIPAAVTAHNTVIIGQMLRKAETAKTN